MNTQEETQNARLSDLRRGWRIWVNFGSEEDCANADQLAGYALASDANEQGGNRPTASDAQWLRGVDLPTA